MDAIRFDALVRAIERRAPRRAAFGVLSGGLAALLTRFGMEDLEAKKKKGKKRRKKKCKGNKRKCGKKCISKNACCKDSECGPDQTCKKGTCTCPSGFIPCGEECIEDFLCCTDADCGGEILSCVEGVCTCPDPSEIPCDVDLCCDPDSQVCNYVTGECLDGSCPETDFCSDEDFFLCTPDCVCVTSIDDTTTCTEGLINECIECTSDEQCATAFGEPAVCIPNGEFCENEFCPGTAAFCVTNSCPSSAPLRARSTAVPVLTLAGRRRAAPR